MSIKQLEPIISRFQAMGAGWTVETQLAQMRDDLDRFFAVYPLALGATWAAISAPAGEWVAAPAARAGQAMLLLHGGGFIMGSARAHRAYASHLSAATGARVFVLDYRLAPEHPFPAALDDSVIAYDWLLDQGLDAKNLAICGDSAGGGLAVSLLAKLRDSGRPLPACAILACPWADLAAAGESYRANAMIDPIATADGARMMGETYAGAAGDLNDPLVSPVHADLSGLPPILIQAGDQEIFLSDVHTLAERAAAARTGVTVDIWPGMIHQFQIHVGLLEESALAVAKIGDFVKQYWPAAQGAGSLRD